MQCRAGQREPRPCVCKTHPKSSRARRSPEQRRTCHGVCQGPPAAMTLQNVFPPDGRWALGKRVCTGLSHAHPGAMQRDPSPTVVCRVCAEPARPGPRPRGRLPFEGLELLPAPGVLASSGVRPFWVSRGLRAASSPSRALSVLQEEGPTVHMIMVKDGFWKAGGRHSPWSMLPAGGP